MSKILTRLFHSSLLLIALFCGINSSSQTVIFNEGIGAISATTPIATWTGWTNGVGLTFSNGGSTNSADLRATSVSSGYSGASGVGNVFFTSTAGNYGFSIGNIQASAYSNLQLYFAYRKESGTALPALAVSYSIDGGLNYTPLTYTFNQAASATVGWYTAPVISLPAAAQVNGLRLKWEKSGSQSVRIDDIKLMGTLPPSLNISGTPSSLNTTQGSPSAETTFSVSASNLTNDLLVSAPSGFEVSLTSGSGFASTLTITPTAGSVTSTTIYIRLTAAATGSYSGNIVASSAGASDVNLSMPVSTVGSSVAQDQSISFATFGSVTYGDANITLGATATSGLTVEYTSSNTSVAQISGNVLTIVGAGTANIIAAQAGDANYNPAPSVSRSLVVNPATLTISNPLVTDKVYNGDNLAVITGTLSGVIGSDVVNLVGTGTFASTDVANGISVTSTSTLSGAQAGNYSLVQPTGLSGNIIGGIQTITFNALPQYSTATSTFTLSATSNATGATIEYTSSNTSVATVTGNIVTIVGSGTTNITASSASVGNYAAASNVVQALNVISAILAWDFTGVSAAVSTNPTYVISGLGTAASSALTRGAGAAASSGGNSFRTTGFQNNGIALANTDYFQWTVSPQVGTAVSLSSIDARFVGTASFYAVPGVTSQFAYSTDGTLFTLIGSPVQSTSLTMSQVDLSGVTALQNIQPGSTVTIRYYASGQTTTGGWGFSSPSAGVMGLILGGTTTALPCPFYQDNDGDGYGNPSVSINATCGSAQTGYVELNNADCNDNDNAINPGATELPCNTTDDNCNGSTNENSVAGCNDPAACNYIATATCSATCDYTQQTYYQDLDADGYGNNLVNQLSCSTPFGYVLAGGDCDDNNPGFNPGAVDVICNGGDENCNGTIDDGAINGCMDVNATNYDATATCNSGCTYVNFTAGNVVVYRIGSGTGALSAAATPSYLDEFNATGLVRSLSVPTSGVNRLTNNGSSTSEGLLGRTADQSKLVMAGYDAAVATASVISAAGVNRVINTVGISPSSMTRLASGTYYASANFRGACVDGNNAWGSGSNTGITYFGSGTPAIVSTTTTNTRYISVQNGQLYYSTGSGTSRGVYKVGTGMPLVSSTTSSVVINQGGTGDPYGFQFSLDGNTCYIADNTTGIEKWTYNGATWSKALTISLGTGFGAKGLAVDFYAGVNPRIYVLATSATQTNIVYLDDNGTTTPTINAISTLTTASANKAYRGIAFAPCTPSVWYADADGDGYGALANTLSYCTQPYGYVNNALDCNDVSAISYPNATEICDDVDNNCDGQMDAPYYNSYYLDADNDGYGYFGTSIMACTVPAGYVTNFDDCEDNNALVYPGASFASASSYNISVNETVTFGPFGNYYLGVPQYDKGIVQDPISGVYVVYFLNNQGFWNFDGSCCYNSQAEALAAYPSSNFVPGIYSPVTANSFTPSQAGTYTFQSYYGVEYGVCFSNIITINVTGIPGCTSVSACNFNPSATIDDGSCTMPQTWYSDGDLDGWDFDLQNSCNSPGVAYTLIPGVNGLGDCNDGNNNIHPTAIELCNSIDDDCDGTADDGLTFVDYYVDVDGDTYGSGVALNACQYPGGVYQVGDIGPSGGRIFYDKGDDVDGWRYLELSPSDLSSGATWGCNGVMLPGIQTSVGSGYQNTLSILQNCNESNIAASLCSDFVLSGYNDWFLPSKDEWNLVYNNLQLTNIVNFVTGVGNQWDRYWTSSQNGGNGWAQDFTPYYQQVTQKSNANRVRAARRFASNYVTNNSDCNDNNNTVHPSATEVCNAIDDDCDGTGDDGLTFVNYYNDQDGDTYGAGTATNACQSPGATYVTNNTDCNDANNAINPSATDICNNSIDEDCSGEDCLSGIFAAIQINNIGQFGTGVQANQTVNLGLGTNTIESPGVGNDLWYKFIAQNNAIRISLTGSTTFNDDNDLGLYNAPANINAGVQLIPIATENDVHPTALGVSTDGGNEIMYYSNLITGNTYYILVRNNNATPGVCSLTVSYLRGSQTDIGPYTNYTGVYGNTCQNFKAAFRPTGTNYTVNRWADITATGTPIWTYVIPANSTICQLGKILPPNMTGSTVTYPLTVDVTYTLPDAFGNMNTVNARGNVVTGVGLSSEASLFVRTVDACPAFKSPTTGSIATNRSVCGIDRYEWQFTEANSAGTPIGLPNVNPIYGPAGASRVLYLATVPGIAGAKFYNVKIRTKHTDGVSLSSWGNTSCVKTIGAAGMAVENNDVISNTLSNGAEVMLYPNPNNGQGVNLQIHGMDGDVQVRLLDGNGRLVKSDRWIVEGSLTTTLDFDQTLSTGLYQVEFIQGNARTTLRMSVVR